MPNRNGEINLLLKMEINLLLKVNLSLRPGTVFWVVFEDVYRFILQVVNGDRATADTIFEDYLGGKLSEQLLSISRGCVSADQAGSSNHNMWKDARRWEVNGG
jgi:hypothetical protein